MGRYWQCLNIKSCFKTLIHLWMIIAMAVPQQLNVDGNQNQTKTGKCRPVMLLHGVFANSRFMKPVVEKIKKAYPETDILNSDAYPLFHSLEPLWNQINGKLGQEFVEFNNKHPNGITFIGHSQGGLLGRSLIEVFSNHSVHTFISIAGVLAGRYGTGIGYAPAIPIAQKPWFLEFITDVYYTPKNQNTVSFANYWKDPKRLQEYLKQNTFLPVISNEVPTNLSRRFKAGFLKLQRHVTIGGPADGVLTPWQSSQYSYYGKNYPAVVDHRDSEIYQKDLFGLRTLDESGRWTRYVREGVDHHAFLTDDKVYEEAILPYLGCPEPVLT